MANEIDFFEMDLTSDEIVPWDGTSSAIDPGTYVFEIVAAEPGKSKSSNQSMITLSLKVVSEGPMKGREMKHWLSLSPKALGRSKHLMQSAGVPFTDKGFSVSSFIGAQFEADVREESYTAYDDKGQASQKSSRKIAADRPVAGTEQQAAPPPASPKPVAPPPAAPTANGRATGAPAQRPTGTGRAQTAR